MSCVYLFLSSYQSIFVVDILLPFWDSFLEKGYCISMEKKTINAIQDEIIEDFEPLEDWMDRYQMIIDYGREVEPLDESYKTQKNLIEGCQSRVWIAAEEKEGNLYLKADSDALIVKGIVALLLKILSGQKAEDIATVDLYFIDRLQLREHLSPTRSNGLYAMIEQIKRLAIEIIARK